MYNNTTNLHIRLASTPKKPKNKPNICSVSRKVKEI